MKKVTFIALIVFFVSFGMFAQKSTSVPVLKKNPDVQQRVSPTINKEPSSAGAQNISVVTAPAKNITSTSAETGYTLSANAIGIVNREGICYNRFYFQSTINRFSSLHYILYKSILYCR
jgi:hypothetical protein